LSRLLLRASIYFNRDVSNVALRKPIVTVILQKVTVVQPPKIRLAGQPVRPALHQLRAAGYGVSELLMTFL
jgi:hypothetical protein